MASLHFSLKGLWRKNERGYRLKPELLRSWATPLRVLSDVPVSRNWFKKTVSNLYQNRYIPNFVFYLNLIFILILIDLIDDIFITSMSCDQSSGHVIQTHSLYCRSKNLILYESKECSRKFREHENWNQYQLYLVKMKNKNYRIIMGVNLNDLGSSGISSISDWLRICWMIAI